MSDIDEVKSRLNIVDVIGERLTLKKTGRNFKGLCPFHNEKTPSFIVSPDRQTFHCFGCGKGGSVIDFVMEYEHIDFSEALEQLAQKAGVTLTRQYTDTKEQQVKNKLYEVNHLASEFYHFMLTKHPLGEKAMFYLKNRGITDKSIETFSLGYSPNSWDALYKFLKKKGYDEETMRDAGLVGRGSHGLFDRFRGRVMFTLKDHRGRVVGFAGRVLEKDSKGEKQEAKYINTQETPIYVKGSVLYGLDVTKGMIAKANEAIVMEGEIDAISSFQEGVSNVVAIKGSALTEEHVHLIRRFAERIVFSLDSDMAGDAAARRGIDIAEKAGLDMKVVMLPKGKDPDEAVREDPVLFKNAIRDAVPIYDYFISSVSKRFDLSSAFGKRKASEELFPILRHISNTVVQAHYVKKISRLFDVDESTVISGMQHMKEPLAERLREEKEETKVQTLSRQEKTEMYLLTLIVQGDTVVFMKEMTQNLKIEGLHHLGVRRILEALQRHLSSSEQYTVQEFAKTIPSELLSVLDEAYLFDIGSLVEDPEKLTKEWQKTLSLLRLIIVRSRMKQVSEELKRNPTPEIEEELQRAIEELSLVEKSKNV